MYKDHTLLVSRVDFIYKFHCICYRMAGNDVHDVAMLYGGRDWTVGLPEEETLCV